MIAGSNRAKFESRYDEANYKDYAEFINHKTNVFLEFMTRKLRGS